MKELTNDIIESIGFERINNSMWKMGNITLQNGYTHQGETIIERILNTKKAYKCCIGGSFEKMLHYESELLDIVFDTTYSI